jgi:hypothetical protein
VAFEAGQGEDPEFRGRWSQLADAAELTGQSEQLETECTRVRAALRLVAGRS